MTMSGNSPGHPTAGPPSSTARPSRKGTRTSSGDESEPTTSSSAPDLCSVWYRLEAGRPRRLLSLGEVTWGQLMTPQHTARLARARDLLADSFDVSDCTLAFYSAAGFS